MKTSMSWESYPPAFLSLVEAATQREVWLDCASEAAAKSMDGKLKAFCGALYRAAARDPEFMAKYATMARRVRFKAIGVRVQCLPRDSAEDNAVVLAALGQKVEVRSVPQNEMDQLGIESAARIMKYQEEMKHAHKLGITTRSAFNLPEDRTALLVDEETKAKARAYLGG